MLTASPDGLSDAALAQALGGPDAGVRPQTVNQLCRRMVADGRVERVGTRPILNRLVPPATPVRKRRRPNGSSATTAASSDPIPETTTPDEVAAVPTEVPAATPARKPRASRATTPADAEVPPASAPPAGRTTSRSRRRDAGETEASPGVEPRADPAPPEPTHPSVVAEAPTVEPAEPEASVAESPVAESPAAEPAGPEGPEGPETEAPVAEAPVSEETTNGAAPHRPTHDVLQAWSRAVNVQATVASWLTQRGATIRSATAEGHGPARDLVVSLDGDDVHVEVTGWPQDGARTHPTTIAGDWFNAAEHAAEERRRAHPGARIVIALPDTRRYRALTRDRSQALDGARAEVWFVDPSGFVHPC